MQITLLRHGEPDIPVWPRIPAAEMGRWVNAYNQAGICPKKYPPHRSVEAVRNSKIVVASDLRRSIESVQKISDREPHIQDAIFQEAGLPFRSMMFPKLSPSVWAAYFRLSWFLGSETNSESISAFRKRIAVATDRLVVLAEQHGTVLLVGHGIANQFIAKRLRCSGWVGPKNAGREYWTFSSYTYGLA